MTLEAMEFNKLFNECIHPCSNHEKEYKLDCNEDGCMLVISCKECKTLIGYAHPDMAAELGVDINELRTVDDRC